jgi:prepilin-type N-terminal cleavage/methylation domain-containing protein
MHRNERGFTLMELMVVIVIVAILAAVAVPLYINYVKDAQRTEAKATIGAIATAQQAYLLRVQSANPGQAATYGTLDQLKTAGLDIRDAEVKWNFTVTVVGTSGYNILAHYKNSNPSIDVYYTYSQGAGGTFSDEAPTP